MKDCVRCNGTRIMSISAKCSDLFFCDMPNDDKFREYRGYVPRGIGIGGSDYVEFSYCLDCGKIQGDFPIMKKDVDKAFKK